MERQKHCVVSLSMTLYPLFSTGITKKTNITKKTRKAWLKNFWHNSLITLTWPHSAVSNVSDCRYVSNCKSRGHNFDPSQVPYFLCDWSWNNFFGRSADSRRVVVSYKRKYVHKVLVNRLVKLAQEKSVVRWTDWPDMTIAVDWDAKHQTKPNQKTYNTAHSYGLQI